METVPQRGGLLLLYVRSGRHKENMERRQPHRLVQMSWQRGIALSLLALAVSARAQTQPEGLNLKQTLLVPTTALTPPMGWNSWNFFEAKIDDAAIRREADALVSSGMRDAGYVYVNVDDGWQGKRDAQGFIHGNSQFPDMKALGAYLHSKGLKFGIYSSPGPQTCAHFEGSYGHEAQDAQTYASWGVDLLKYDLCSFGKDEMRAKYLNDVPKQNGMMRAAYQTMSDALRHTGRPIVYSVCQYGIDDVWTWAAGEGGNMWRTTGDIKPNFQRIAEIGFQQAGLARFAGPGHWNDPDMLEVGNGDLTAEENVTHFTLWAMLAAPLISGNDVTHMPKEIASILMNKEVIAIDQDPMGVEGGRRWAQGPLEVWTKALSHGDLAVAIFNRSDIPITLSSLRDTMRSAGLKDELVGRDLWTGNAVDLSSRDVTVELAKHGSMLLRMHER
jgi:alpha-galactosidase